MKLVLHESGFDEFVLFQWRAVRRRVVLWSFVRRRAVQRRAVQQKGPLAMGCRVRGFGFNSSF